MSGFANLRAKFENKDENSPPSRGRSPAGQDNVKGSGRKIRTSFVSVERSGQMSPLIDQRESMGSNEDQTFVTEGAKDPKAAMNIQNVDGPKTNGVTAASKKQEGGQESRKKQGNPDTANKHGNGTLELEEAVDQDAINPDKPTTAGEDDAPSMLPSDPKDEGAISGGAALVPKGESLGTLLKGSEFEAEKEPSKKMSPKKSPQKSPQKSPKKAAAPANPSTPVKKTRDSPKSTPAKAVGTPNVNGSPKTKSATPRPSTLNRPQAPSALNPAGTPPSATEDAKTPISETASASPVASKPPMKQPREKTSLPRQSTPKQAGDAPKPADKERPKPSVPKASRLSTNTRASQPAGPATTSKPNGAVATGASKKSGPRSPNMVKPKPRSPTRPVRLPGAATASTAASSAKTGSTVPPRPESRAATSNASKPSTLNKPNGVKGPPKTTLANIRSRAPRSSLPASTIEQKPKPKPRTSIASTSAPGNDFLSRMMRPTTSSASKTHEKVEQKTPPKRRISARPKRISDETGEKGERKDVEAGAGSKEPATEQGEQAANHIKPENHEENAAPEPTEEAPIEATAETNGNTVPSTNENTVAAL
ncbi:MAG: hypothetical protein Q9168_008323 [Polycauliona sp. 1 TL-2023]